MPDTKVLWRRHRCPSLWWRCDSSRSSTVALAAASPVRWCDDKVGQERKTAGVQLPTFPTSLCVSRTCTQFPSPLVPASTFACAPSTSNRKTTAFHLDTRASRHSHALPLGHLTNDVEAEGACACALHSINVTSSHLWEPEAHKATSTRAAPPGHLHSPQSSLPLPRPSSPTLKPSTRQTTKPHLDHFTSLDLLDYLLTFTPILNTSLIASHQLAGPPPPPCRNTGSRDTTTMNPAATTACKRILHGKK